MANNYVFNDSLPVAPLKIAALESCQELASKVNDHVVQFRRNDMEELMRRKICITAVMTWIPTFFPAAAQDSAQEKERPLSVNPSAVPMSL